MTEHTDWNQGLVVTLTATSNNDLSPHLPLRGRLRIHEVRPDGYASPSQFTFLQLDDSGNPVGSEVSADDAAFTYAPPRQQQSGPRSNAREGTDLHAPWPPRDRDTETRGTAGPFDHWEHDHTSLVHVLWAARRFGFTAEENADEIASMILRSRWHAASKNHAISDAQAPTPDQEQHR